MMTFFAMALARLFRARRMRLAGKPKAKYIMQRVYAGAFLVCSALPAFIGYVKAPGLMMRFTGEMSEIVTDYIGSCLENPMDRGPWWAAVHGVTRSQTRLSF